MPDLTIRPLRIDDAEACDAIIASLPYFFGDPDGVRDCAAAVRTQRGFVAERDGAVIGFITVEPTSPGAAEITWMAVHADHRRAGAGRALVEAAATAARDYGASVVFVLTLGESVPEDERGGDNYESTRRFYRSAGFVPLRDFALSTWNDSHAHIMARPLGVAAQATEFNALTPEFAVSDFERSLQFYTEICGFGVRYSRQEDRFAFLERGGAGLGPAAQLMIEQTTDPSRLWVTGELEHPYGRGMHLQLEVEDVDALHAAVAASGARIVVPMEERWYRADAKLLGSRQFVVADPDGYLLRFFGDLGERDA